MEKSRRDFFKKGLMGSLVLGTASLSHSAKAVTSMVESKRAKRVLMISLDGICVEGFLKARTPRLDTLLAEGVLSLQTRVVMPSVTLPNWTSHLTGSGPKQNTVNTAAVILHLFKIKQPACWTGEVPVSIGR